KLKPEVDQDQKALVKAKPKRKKILGKKLPTRSTAGNIEPSPDDDGIWFECNVPFRVNIPFPISMKNLFGPQPFSENSNLQMFKALVPTGKQQKDTKMNCPFNLSMCPALPPQDLESSTNTPKAIKCARKKGFRRGRKHCPCETSTQTIEEESDPVLSCLEQIRNHLAAKSPEIQEKSFFRCFAEKSTNVRSIQKQTNEPDVEKGKESASKETLQDKTSSSISSQKSLLTTSLNMLPLPNSEDTKIEILKNVPKTASNSNAKDLSISIEIQKESEEKNENLPDSNRKDIDLPNPSDADKEKDVPYATEPVLKSAICFCRLPQGFPKCTRILMPGSVCQGHFMGKYHMPRWQYSRPPQQRDFQYIQRQAFKKQATSKDDDIRIKSGNSIQVNESNISSRTRSNYESMSRSSTSSSSKSSFEASISKKQPTTSRFNHSDRKFGPEGSSRSSKFQGSEDLSQKSHRYISSNESILSSRKTSHKDSEIIGTKSNKTPKECDCINIKSKTEKLQRNQTGNKRNQKQNSRISSGGETIPEEWTNQRYKNCQICKIEAEPDNSEIDKSGSNIINDSDKFVSKGNSRQERLRKNKKPRIDEYLPYQMSHFRKMVTQPKTLNQSRYEDREWFYKQRSQSAPECWILQGSRRNHTNRSEKSYLCQPPQCPTYSENVLVLQDETCESESEDYELIRNDKGTTNTRWCECQTPDYSINADILKHLKEQERPCNSVQVQRITPIPRDNRCPDDYDILQPEQGRENPPLVLVPFRVNRREIINISRPKKWRELGMNFTKLRTNQFQRTPQSAMYNKEKWSRDRYSNSSSSQSENTSPSNSSSSRTNTLFSKRTHQKKSLDKRKNNFQNIKQLSYPGSRKCHHKTCHIGSIISLTSYSPSSQSNASVENRVRPKNTEYPSYTRLGGLQNESNVSCNSKLIRSTFNSRQRKDSQDSHFKYTKKQARKDESLISHSQYGFRSDRNNPDNLQSLRRFHNSAITGSSHYAATQSNPNGLTWSEPDRNSKLVVPLKASSLNKSIERSNGTMRSTDVETLQTVTLMQPRKLRSSDSAGIRNQAIDIENTVLIETRTPCNRENLLQTCGRPPCNFCPRQYTGLPPSLQQGFMISKPPDHTIQPQTSMSAPQNRTPFDENYLIDPRDQWRTIKSPASAPVMKAPFQRQRLMSSYQPTNSLYPHFQEHQSNNPGYYTQTLKENINMLPEGFYDQTVNKYNITRMDSNFQPPPLIPEFLLVQQQPFFGLPASPHGNQFQQQLVMGSVQQLHRPFFPTQNQYPAELQTHPSMFCPQQSVKLDDYDQSEYQI
ncbi:hypothetical protein KR084_004753, partial [Drosophila pseudotakahashii]